MKKLRIIDGHWRVHSQFDVYAGGYYVGNTRNNLGVGNSYDIDHAILIADAGNTYHATGMLPSEMAERIKALEEALRPFAHPDLCETLGGNVQGDDSPLWARNKAMLKLGHFKHARALLNPINEAHSHLITKPE